MVLWLVGGVCALCGALCYGELAAALPRSGGEYHFLSRIYHPAVGFLAGWLSATVGFAAPIAAAAMAFGKYFGHVWPGANPLALSLAVVVAVAVVHSCGIGLGSVFQNLVTSFKVLLILWLIGAGVAMAGPQPVSFAPAAGDPALIGSAPFAIGLVYVMYSYSGWNASAYIAGEVREPGRNLPRSLAIGTLFVVALYLALNAIFLRSAPFAELGAAKEEVSYAAASHIFPREGARVMAGLISLGLVSSISAMTWIGPRVAMTMGEDCRALSFLAVKTRGGVPGAALGLQLGVVILLLLTATFDKVVNYIQFSLTVCSFLTVLGLIVLRVREPALARPYKTWGYPVTPLLFLGISLWMMIHQLRERPLESGAACSPWRSGWPCISLPQAAPPPRNGLA